MEAWDMQKQMALFSPGSWPETVQILCALAPIWLFGALIGLLLPRPRWLEASGRSGVLFYVSPPGLFLRRLFLFCHGAYIAREVWGHFTLPGTFANLLAATRSWLSGQGFVVPHDVQVRHVRTKKASQSSRQLSSGRDGSLQWYVDEDDLQFFKDRIEAAEAPAGCTPWELMMDSDFGHFTYTAWRRTMPNGKTEYKSVTVADDATAEEFLDFYLDDPTRLKWDGLISETEVLENGSGRHRCQVVRWVRSFPFSFISQREYIIGRRMWREKGCLYGITKAIEHSRAVHNPNIVRMDVFYSMWRSRTVPCPRGSNKPACETVLLHHEEFKIPERLARFAVRHGMAGFVKKLGWEVPLFVEWRRQRAGPFEEDAEAFGVKNMPNPPLPRVTSAVEEVPNTAEEPRDSASDCSTPRALRRRRRRSSRRALRSEPGPQKRWQQVAFGLVAAAVAVAIGRSSAQQNRQH